MLAIEKAPEIQQMYSLNMPVSQVRTKVRQEFERHRYVSQLRVVDMLLTQSHMEFQVCFEHNQLQERDKRQGAVDRRVRRTTRPTFWGQIPSLIKTDAYLGVRIGNAELLEATTTRP